MSSKKVKSILKIKYFFYYIRNATHAEKVWVLKIAGAVRHHHPDECAAGSSVSRPGDEGGGRTKEQGSSIRMYTWIKVEKVYRKWLARKMKKNSFSPPPPCLLRPHFSVAAAPPLQSAPRRIEANRDALFFSSAGPPSTRHPGYWQVSGAPLFFTHERKSMKYFFFLRWCSISSREKKCGH